MRFKINNTILNVFKAALKIIIRRAHRLSSCIILAARRWRGLKLSSGLKKITTASRRSFRHRDRFGFSASRRRRGKGKLVTEPSAIAGGSVNAAI